MDEPPESELRRTQRERDLYLALLSLGDQEELEPFLESALSLVVEATDAARGYLEIRDPDADSDAAWWLAQACSDEEVDDIRACISRGVVAEALASGQTILTSSALLDERFRHRESVQANRIEGVLCAPIGGDARLGVVYLEGMGGGEPFSDEDRDQAERLARHLAPLTDRLLTRRRVAEIRDATHELRQRHQLEGFVGRSPAIAAALRQAMLAAPLDVSVLLTGPSGTGKSQLCRAIHANSARAQGPFVELNCAAIPETLIESELFGALKGSHSEARRDMVGKVAAAEGGTLCLDEIGELSPPSQAKLLQLLQSKQYFPLGSSEPVHADVRVIAATNADLVQAVEDKRFREDLFYRLQVLPIELPALADRSEDVAPLVEFLAGAVCERHGLPPRTLSHGALLSIRAAPWPGNVRQLEHALEAAAIRAAGEGSDCIEARHVFPEAAGEAEEEAEPSYQEATRRFQKDLLAKTLDETGWNVTETARRLDLARSHVYNLIATFGLERARG